MLRRLNEAAFDYDEQKSTAGIPRAVKTTPGPLLAITTWAKLLQSIDDELAGMNHRREMT
jgi:hypothetical protein